MAHRRLGIIEFLWIIEVPPDPPSQTDSPSAPNSQDTQDPPNQSDSQTPYLIFDRELEEEEDEMDNEEVKSPHKFGGAATNADEDA